MNITEKSKKNNEIKLLQKNFVLNVLIVLSVLVVLIVLYGVQGARHPIIAVKNLPASTG